MSEETSEEVIEETVVETPEITEEEPSSEQEEPQVEQPLLAGKYKSAEELERAYAEANAANTKMAQELAQAKKEPLTADKQQIADEIKGLGFMTQEQFERQAAVQSQAQKDNAEIQTLGLTGTQETALRKYALSGDNVTKSMTDCWNELQSAVGGKIVSRKTTIKPKTGNRSGFTEKTPTELSKLPKEEYDKYWVDYAANKAGQ